MSLMALANRRSYRLILTTMVALLFTAGPLGVQQVRAAAQLQDRSLQISDNRAGKTTKYTVGMTLQTAATMGSIRVLFCSDFALVYYPCTPPAGFSAKNAIVTHETGISGFTVDTANSTDNIIILTRTAAAVTPGTISIELSNVTNQSYEGSAFARYHTYQTTDGSGTATDEGSVAYSILGDFSISTEVPPYLTMCVGIKIANYDCSDVQGDFLQLGDFSTSRATIGQSQVALATNAEDGYTIRVQGSTMVSGNNVLPNLTSPRVSLPGVSQFGINLRANTIPAGGSNPAGPGSGAPTSDYGQANSFKYQSGNVIASYSTVDDYRRYTISYLVNIAKDQPPGVYSSSFSYIGLGNF